ncbi:protein ALP1-like [Xenia sp. Carnegie-2017]|uniref:protein ALP1-like n=1 Tax=Xenia sp. Carnegie-2017 TaxID=2897299 RepID=UPI001F043B23|nr:protein ALP1-like [Xenia sp. Carnegie-2017]
MDEWKKKLPLVLFTSALLSSVATLEIIPAVVMSLERERERRQRLTTMTAILGMQTKKFSLLLHSIKRGKRKGRRRRFWVRPRRSSEWWTNFMNGFVVEEEWRENFRMSKMAFTKLCNLLQPFLEKKVTNMRVPISVEKQLAITLYYLSDEGRYRKVANAFGVSRSSVSLIVRRCMGAIDGTHIFIKRPSTSPTDYLNRKNRYSLNVQAVCDFKYRFMYLVIKWPGRVHDARIFSNSNINRKFRENESFKCQKQIVDDEMPVPVCILGDPAYPLLPFLMKEFPGGGNSLQQQYFGWRLSSARMVIECAFGRLKGRFGILKREMDINTEDLPYVIYACFVLHNYCEEEKQVVAEEEISKAMECKKQFQPPILGNRYTLGNNDEQSGKIIRDIFVKFFD